MNEKEVKRYFKKLNTTFVGVNKYDDFAKMFMNLIKSGNTTLYQKERRERRIFDDSWMDSVEGAIPVIDKLTRNPRENLAKVGSVVPVEMAKRIDKDTVRHLAMNTQLIKEIDEDGMVKPSKVLSFYYEADLGTYENRFLRSLIDKVYIFIEKRYDLIVKKMRTEYVNYFNIKSDVEWNEAEIEYDITMRINKTVPNDEVDKRNQELFDRMTNMRKAATNIKMSSFMQEMRDYAPVTPPIMKTNIIMKNPDFRQCYYLWVLMDQVDQIGYDIDVFERVIDFKDDYLKDIVNTLMVLYATIANYQEDDFLISQDSPFEYRKIKRPRIKKTDPNDQHIQPGYYEFENNQLNQYYLDQIRGSNLSRFKTLREAGVPMNQAIDIVFQQINAINTAVYEDYIKHAYSTEEAATLEDKIQIQKKALEVYRQIEKIKRDDMRQFSTNKAIALLNLRNLQGELKKLRKIEAEKKARERQKEKIQKEAEKKKKLQAEEEKKRQLEKAKQVLEQAESEKKQKQSNSAKTKPVNNREEERL
jgi:exonuclease SbcC